MRGLQLGFAWRSALFFCLATLAMTWPLAASPAHLISSRNDYYLGLWNLWWVARALTEPGLEVFWTDALFAPFGHGLEVQPLTLLQTVPAVPLTLLAGPVVAYNVLVLVSFWMAGWVTSLWVRKLGGDEVAGLVAGVVFGFSPFHYTYLAQLNLVPIGVVPLYFLAALSLQREPTAVRAALTGAALAAVGLASWYYGVGVGLAATALSLARLAGRERGPVSRRLGLEAVHWSTCALLLAPVVLAMLPGFGAGEAEGELEGMGIVMGNFKGSETVVGLHSFIGLAALLLAVAGCRRSRVALSLLAMALAFFVLSLGSTVEFGGRVLELPFAALDHIPLVGAVRFPDRFFVLTQLGVAALAGLGAARLRAGGVRGARGGLAASTLLVVLPLLEFRPGALPLASAPEDTPIPSADQGEPGAVFTVPLRLSNLDSESMYQQIRHGRPIPGGYLTRNAGPARDRLLTLDPLLLALMGAPPDRLPRKLGRALHGQGFVYLAVQREPLVPLGPTSRRELLGPFFLGGRAFLRQRLFPAYSRRAEWLESSDAWVRELTGRWGPPVGRSAHTVVFAVPGDR